MTPKPVVWVPYWIVSIIIIIIIIIIRWNNINSNLIIQPSILA